MSREVFKAWAIRFSDPEIQAGVAPFVGRYYFGKAPERFEGCRSLLFATKQTTRAQIGKAHNDAKILQCTPERVLVTIESVGDMDEGPRRQVAEASTPTALAEIVDGWVAEATITEGLYLESAKQLERAHERAADLQGQLVHGAAELTTARGAGESQRLEILAQKLEIDASHKALATAEGMLKTETEALEASRELHIASRRERDSEREVLTQARESFRALQVTLEEKHGLLCRSRSELTTAIATIDERDETITAGVARCEHLTTALEAHLKKIGELTAERDDALMVGDHRTVQITELEGELKHARRGIADLTEIIRRRGPTSGDIEEFDRITGKPEPTPQLGGQLELEADAEITEIILPAGCTLTLTANRAEPMTARIQGGRAWVEPPKPKPVAGQITELEAAKPRRRWRWPRLLLRGGA